MKPSRHTWLMLAPPLGLALAHGAECVNYFRWRQLPFGQEQMHAGLLRPDDQPAPGWHEVAQVAQELAVLRHESWQWPEPAMRTGRAQVVLVFDYQADWMVAIEPQGRQASVLHMAFAWYSAARSLGLDLDLLPAGDGRATNG